VTETSEFQFYPSEVQVDAWLEAIETVFHKLPSTRMYCYIDGQGHAYTQEFVTLATAWFRLYA
jgi:hypothetical protein